MREIVYGYDDASKTVTVQLTEFPALTFYDNGAIQAGWSHNQGLAGSFWPYTLYCYNADTDTYESVGWVDAWDRSLKDTDFNDNPFPEDVDVNGDGFVYYISSGDEYDGETPVSTEEYTKWRDAYVGDAAAVEIPFVSLTEENIQNVQ